MCGGIGRPRGLARWNCAQRRQIGLAAVGGIHPDVARGVRTTQHGGELAAVVPRGMRDGEAADEAVRTVAMPT
jgi:hypothetical protein